MVLIDVAYTKLWQFSVATGVNLNTSVSLKHINFKIKKDFPRQQNCYKSLANAIIKLTYCMWDLQSSMYHNIFLDKEIIFIFLN